VLASLGRRADDVVVGGIIFGSGGVILRVGGGILFGVGLGEAQFSATVMDSQHDNFFSFF
jgi:hypothetical protein